MNVHMNKKFGWVIGTLVITLLAVGLYRTATVLAQGNGPQTASDHRGLGGQGGGHGLGDTSLQAVADVLGMTLDEVSTVLAEGKTCKTWRVVASNQEMAINYRLDNENGDV